ncbi:O-methyltransferase [Bacillus spongiae]|uniref:O-methyltransferase n=1 Tax=Bacillus spongiae TaxID=2683610 RepID=A0ABU8H8D3_9BACI
MTVPVIWNNVDLYFQNNLQQEDPVMKSVLKANEEAGLPAIDVSPNQGKMLYLLAKLKKANNILEIGTLGGYSSIWLARALPNDGQIMSLEYSEKHASVARQNIRNAGLKDKVTILVGPALETLPTIEEKGYHHFDFIFIDADKQNNANYVQWGLKLCKPGAVIIVDNVVRNGQVLKEDEHDPNIQGVRDCIELFSSEPRIDATAIQTVGSKGYDGFLLGIVE